MPNCHNLSYSLMTQSDFTSILNRVIAPELASMLITYSHLILITSLNHMINVYM